MDEPTFQDYPGQMNNVLAFTNKWKRATATTSSKIHYFKKKKFLSPHKISKKSEWTHRYYHILIEFTYKIKYIDVIQKFSQPVCFVNKSYNL